ncbi:nuclear transport factor 2 family protein [uncultured Herbaspirillum sp.]|uniref:nuclear transport factor 2 family protein n=1 Tax=uncultured Herbaspirillum sp. TaxID=160236 RepID=UPI00258CDFD1|nr:nuclear transport factor 2 family protein [uncultured Herbaspirillum sp.]
MSSPVQLPSSSSANASVTIETLQAFSDAWNRHDIDALMQFMHPECEFLTAAGHETHGTRHTGPQAVARAFASAWISVPDAQWRNARHWVAGERGVSEWTFTGTAADGTPIQADGVDLFVFRDGKILQKNVFRKIRTPKPA